MRISFDNRYSPWYKSRIVCSNKSYPLFFGEITLQITYIALNTSFCLWILTPVCVVLGRNRRATEDTYRAQHVEYISAYSFEQVIANFEGLVGNVENGSLRQLVVTAKTQEEFEIGVHALEGKSGFL